MARRSTSRSTSDGDVVVVGQIGGPHGIRGDVRVDPRTDVPDRFAPGTVLDCDGVGPLTVAALRGDRGHPIVSFAGIDSRDAALKLKGRYLRVTAADARGRVARGAFLWRDLIGLTVTRPDGSEVGAVRELIRAGGADVLVVVDADGRETLLPMIDAVVRSVDLTAGRIVAAPQEELA